VERVGSQFLEGLSDKNQRQTDQCRRILGRDLFEQCDAEAFGFEAAGTVEWIFETHVAFERCVIEAPKPDGRPVHVLERLAGVGGDDGDGRMEQHDLPLGSAELGNRDLGSPRLAEHPLVERGDLVRANDDSASLANAPGFRECQARRHCRRAFALYGRFSHAGRPRREWQPEPGQQLATIRRRRGQYDLRQRQASIVRVCVTHGFDVRNLLTYDAPPMSGSLRAWYSLRDLESLADRGVTLSGDLDIDKLTRLESLLHSSVGSVRATLHFRQRGDGWVAIELGYEASVQLVCQRCLEPFRHELDDTVNVVVTDGDSVPSAMPAGYEPFELEEGRLQPARLVEDELIVALPLVPKHARVEDCGSLARELTKLS
jgi:uncharacterized protein